MGDLKILMKTRNSEHCVRYLHSARCFVLSRRVARVGLIGRWSCLY